MFFAVKNLNGMKKNEKNQGGAHRKRLNKKSFGWSENFRSRGLKDSSLFLGTRRKI
jgi:hypothetical protein